MVYVVINSAYFTLMNKLETKYLSAIDKIEEIE